MSIFVDVAQWDMRWFEVSFLLLEKTGELVHPKGADLPALDCTMYAGPTAVAVHKDRIGLIRRILVSNTYPVLLDGAEQFIDLLTRCRSVCRS